MNYIPKNLWNLLTRCSLLILCIASFSFSKGHSQKSTSVTKPLPASFTARRFLLRDEGMSQLCYVDISHPDANWYMPVPAGRDMQLTGGGKVLIGTGTGYEEREIATGKKVFELTAFTGTVAARRLRNGNTLLTGVNWQGKQGIVLVEVNEAGTVQQTITYPGFDYVRLVRETASGNFLVTADNVVFEGTRSGDIVWKVKISSKEKTHVWQALRLKNGNTVISTGFAKNFQIFNKEGNLTDSIGGPADVRPNFFAGYQVLANGDYIVTNWQGHGPTFGASGTQVLEYSPDGKLVWSWKQDAAKFSSLQGVIVLDGLDVNYLHIEDENGKLAPVKNK